jgi:hypothetical protein
VPWLLSFLSADADYRPAFDRFEEMFNAMQGPRDMMMISTGLPGETTVYLSLPNQKLAVAYPGFEEVQLADLPVEATLLIGHQDAFQEHFRFPRRD